ncbi:uncharacterized protein LTR77_000544 [Saxophila tyrrhenica]|uniref:Xylanolytic transcriptional activator regulatory domain-containing protein n=1 Tax=Saxophila tyrrhenica TaxID=1690608 RepID=A0AAV9PRN8_9PEZI|nr:hypothetical protein LTR77_000544 [Saxophila tyrrhenica]
MPTYRFLHQPTVVEWLASYHSTTDGTNADYSLSSAQQAIVLMVLATAIFFQADDKAGVSEPYLRAAEMKLAQETGKVRLESVQARLAICIYLLHTSRPNQAWYTFGTTAQLIQALGMHRARASSGHQLDTIITECRKRTFWAASTLDAYLSCLLGRPPLINIDDVDQQFPAAADDDLITAGGVEANSLHRDPVIQGSIYHAKITCIVKKALREQYSVTKHPDAHKAKVAARLNGELKEWKASLPVILSGVVHPSSLIQVFQRQIAVLEMADSLALIMVNRPLLLVDASVENRSSVRVCLSAASTILNTAPGFVANRPTLPAFWFTQFVTFNALSIIYVWLIQRWRGRLPSLETPLTDNELYDKAETMQKHLADASQANAPNLRYSILLEELQQEAGRLIGKHTDARQASDSTHAPKEGYPDAAAVSTLEDSVFNHQTDTTSLVSLSGDDCFESDIFLQLDSFPFPDFDLEALGEIV